MNKVEVNVNSPEMNSETKNGGTDVNTNVEVSPVGI